MHPDIARFYSADSPNFYNKWNPQLLAVGIGQDFMDVMAVTESFTRDDCWGVAAIIAKIVGFNCWR